MLLPIRVNKAVYILLTGWMGVLPRVRAAGRRPLARLHFDARCGGAGMKEWQPGPRAGVGRREGPRDSRRRSVRARVGRIVRRIVGVDVGRGRSPRRDAVEYAVDGERGRTARTAGADGVEVLASAVVLVMPLTGPHVVRRRGMFLGHDGGHAERQQRPRRRRRRRRRVRRRRKTTSGRKIVDGSSRRGRRGGGRIADRVRRIVAGRFHAGGGRVESSIHRRRRRRRTETAGEQGHQTSRVDELSRRDSAARNFPRLLPATALTQLASSD